MDADSPASLTALATARFRATHQLLEGGSVLRDPLAVRIVGEPEDDLRALDVDRRLRLLVCARSRYAEEVLAAAVPRGLDQLVVLGAGLDTFAYRNPYPGLRVVEIDHPATQAWKLERLSAAGIAVPDTVSHVSTQFEQDDLGEVLAGCVDVSRPVLVWWLGVTPYLTLDAITATLGTLAGLPHCAVVLDHLAQDPRASVFARAWEKQRAARVAAVGEPWITSLSGEELARLGERCGFDGVHLEDEAAVVRRALGRGRGRGPAREPRVTHLALLTKGWWPDGSPG
ncbi:class I SAM-dependent methyltransferase [Nocardioides cynanchi]|uniref:class I SAM-dependent methyltransferase n=1 Tax=Nocardioides cynanchi TaxID=2558918 RepID=UPI00177A89E2|nr:class I SAM-dependent methyltransferase [Nocardioides cynanchi]